MAETATGFAGSAACAGCHRAETDAWAKSDHAWALQEPNSASILGDFNSTTLTSKGVTNRFFRQADDYMVETEGPQGKAAGYPIRYVAGIRPLQQYLLETGDGRLQALDIAWDTNAGKWFDLYPDQPTPAGNGLHRTGTYKNWQARCADCHQTGFDKGYDAQTESYRSHWAELTVACESCHGPAAAHVKLAEAARSGGISKPLPALQPLGPGQQAAELATCGKCHSRRAAFSQQSAPVGAAFDDQLKLALLTPDLYFADGQQDAEVNNLGSFLQSKMAARGVTCSNCREPHGGTLLAAGNAVCTQCHSEAGCREFPTLTRKDYDSPSHSHHAEGSDASACVNCHMPERTYMSIDSRRDHFFRRPDPLQSAAARAPDVCTGCLADKTAEWAAGHIAEWAPSADTSWQDRSAFIAFVAGDRSPAALQALADYSSDIAHPAIARASAAQLLQDADAPKLKEGLLALTRDPDALVRAAAAGLLRQTDPAARYQQLSPLLTDPSRVVRDAVAGELAFHVPSPNDGDDAAALDKAIAEYLTAATILPIPRKARWQWPV